MTEQERLEALKKWYVDSISLEEKCKAWWDSRVAGKTGDELTQKQLMLKDKIEIWVYKRAQVKAILEENGMFIM